MIKHSLPILIITIILTAAASGCGRAAAPNGVNIIAPNGVSIIAPNGDEIMAPNGGGLKVVCTLFPLYDWTKNIIGEAADKTDVSLLMKNGADLHNYQPTVDDIVTISECDLFIYVGGVSDGWVAGALRGAVNKDIVVINLLETLGGAVKPVVIIEGMQDDGDERAQTPAGGADSGGDEANGGAGRGAGAEKAGRVATGAGVFAGAGAYWEGAECDEHVWLSLKNAQFFCAQIENALSGLDSDNASMYKRNAAEYIGKLAALDSQYRKAVAEAPSRTLLFGDRFPFRYLTDDYGVDYYAAFPGCSTETEASFETVIFLANKTDELGLGSVIITENSDGQIAKTVAANTKNKNQRILTLNSMQAAPSGAAAAGSYLSIMESNLRVLRDALGVK